MDTAGEGESGMKRESSINTHTLPCVKQLDRMTCMTYAQQQLDKYTFHVQKEQLQTWTIFWAIKQASTNLKGLYVFFLI